jgi:SAM-dependent methyltransferase
MVIQALARRRTRVDFHDPRRTTPVSRHFGLERGTPIDRYYIEQFLDGAREELSGRVLEIGEARYTSRFARPTRSSVLHVEAGHDAELVGDLTRHDTLPALAFDTVICTQTLGVIYDVRAAVEGLHHLLAPGGRAAITVAGISQRSRHDAERWGDYWRFTEASLRRLCAAFDRVEVTSFGNVAAAVALLQGVAVEDLPDPSVLDARDPDYPVTLGVLAVKRG